MAEAPIAANTEQAALVDAVDAGFSLTIVGEPRLDGLRKTFGTVGEATGAAIPLAYTHNLDVIITRSAIRQHVERELRAMAEAEVDDHA